MSDKYDHGVRGHVVMAGAALTLLVCVLLARHFRGSDLAPWKAVEAGHVAKAKPGVPLVKQEPSPELTKADMYARREQITVEQRKRTASVLVGLLKHCNDAKNPGAREDILAGLVRYPQEARLALNDAIAAEQEPNAKANLVSGLADLDRRIHSTAKERK